MRREKKTKKNKNVIKDWFLTFLGIGLVVAGFLIHKSSVSSTDKMIVTIPYIFIGIGCGTFGHFTGNIIKHFSIENHEELEKRMQIAKNDERNILIAEKSKAKAYDLMIYMFAAMLIIFSLMSVDKIAIIIMAAIYLSIQIYALYWRFKYENKM